MVEFSYLNIGKHLAGKAPIYIYIFFLKMKCSNWLGRIVLFRDNQTSKPRKRENILR